HRAIVNVHDDPSTAGLDIIHDPATADRLRPLGATRRRRHVNKHGRPKPNGHLAVWAAGAIYRWLDADHRYSKHHKWGAGHIRDHCNNLGSGPHFKVRPDNSICDLSNGPK